MIKIEKIKENTDPSYFGNFKGAKQYYVYYRNHYYMQKIINILLSMYIFKTINI